MKKNKIKPTHPTVTLRIGDREVNPSFSAAYEYSKVMAVIESCITAKQLDGAQNMANLFRQKWDSDKASPLLKAELDRRISVLRTEKDADI